MGLSSTLTSNFTLFISTEVVVTVTPIFVPPAVSTQRWVAPLAIEVTVAIDGISLLAHLGFQLSLTVLSTCAFDTAAVLPTSTAPISDEEAEL